MVGNQNKIECHHGNLRRSCPLCEYEAEIADLRAQLAESERRRVELAEAASAVAEWWTHKDTHCEVMPAPMLLDRLAALVGEGE